MNPSDNSFGTAVITPRWLFVLAAATPQIAGDPILVDESLEQIAPETIEPGDIVGISVHTGNALRGYAVGRMARARGAWVVYGGIHATLFPEEAFERGEAHAVVTGDGDVAWGRVVKDCLAGKPEHIYEGGRIEGKGGFFDDAVVGPGIFPGEGPEDFGDEGAAVVGVGHDDRAPAGARVEHEGAAETLVGAGVGELECITGAEDADAQPVVAAGELRRDHGPGGRWF